MQEIRWKEPEIINAIEKQRALEERPQRVRNLALLWLAAIAVYAVIVFAALAYFVPQDNAIPFSWRSFWGFAPMLIPNLLLGFYSAWQGTLRFADSYCVTKLGVTRLNAMQNFARRDIANYRFELCDDAPNLRGLIVEARGRKAPLRLYYEGEQLEERISNAMTLGIASTRKTISQGTIPT